MCRCHYTIVGILIFKNGILTTDKTVNITPSLGFDRRTILTISLSDSELKTYISSLYFSPLSSTIPGNSWVWSKNKQYLIFSVLSKDSIDYFKFEGESFKGPKKQNIYCFDRSDRKITQILELYPKDISCLYQRFYVRGTKLFFQAKYVYEVDLKKKTCIKIKDE